MADRERSTCGLGERPGGFEGVSTDHDRAISIAEINISKSLRRHFHRVCRTKNLLDRHCLAPALPIKGLQPIEVVGANPGTRVASRS
jgi:hypothetical protein